MTWFQQERQRFISAYLDDFGKINRQDIIERFSIGSSAAARDLKEFCAKNPDVFYDMSAREYTRIEKESK